MLTYDDVSYPVIRKDDKYVYKCALQNAQFFTNDCARTVRPGYNLQVVWTIVYNPLLTYYGSMCVMAKGESTIQRKGAEPSTRTQGGVGNEGDSVRP